ncbi:MAG: hypothetical protein D6730_19705 [Bacteroidetes bacterium]|nr:MAG: hypothetical protein D6730_19705 [Bacteroidota bacterium]
MSRNTRNLLITLTVIVGIILGTQLILKDYLYYKKVLRDQDIESCERYLHSFPDGLYSKKVLTLKDDYEFEQAKESGTAEAYDAYIRKYEPDGRHLEEAKKKAEYLHFQALTKRANLKEILTLLKRFPDSEYVDEFEQQEKMLWERHRNNFLAYARQHNYAPEFIGAMERLFGYMQQQRATELYLTTYLNKDSVKDWNDYPMEVRYLWDSPQHLRTAFDRELLAKEWAIAANDPTFTLPSDYRKPSDNQPMKATSNLNLGDFRRITNSFPRQLKEELDKALQFPEIVVVNRKSEIPANTPAIVLTCMPYNRTVKLENTEVPAIYMRLKKRRTGSRDRERQRSNREYQLGFNGYFMLLDFNWKVAFVNDRMQDGEVFLSKTYSPGMLTHFFDKTKIRREYSRMIKTTYEEFSGEFNQATNLKLAVKD